MRTFAAPTEGPITPHRQRIRIASLTYHDVTDDPTSSGFQRRGARSYCTTTANFRRQLDAIERSQQAPGRITDVDWSRAGRHLMLTFDDGGRSALDAGAELCRRGWRGHFFVTTALIGQRTFLQAADIRELRSQGHIIGSHSHTHPDIFRELPMPAMLTEWRVSRDLLSQLLGEDVVVASVPGGDVSGPVFHTAASAGYRFLFTSEPRPVPQRIDACWVLGRAVLKRGATPRYVGQLAELDGWRREAVKRTLKNSARRTFPGLYRRYVRALAAE
jgi:peptidoglycan/xylan/chitin deacetylase (PgdA/CDA1 family)